MALTLTKIGIVNPTQPQLDVGSTALRLQEHIVDVTLGATSDYGANGVDLTSSVIIGSSGINVAQVVDVSDAVVRQSGGAVRSLVYRFDRANKSLRFFKQSQGILSAAGGQAVSAAGGTETSLLSFSVPGGTLAANGQSLRVTAWGTCSGADANAKTLKMRLGASGITGTALDNGNAWQASKAFQWQLSALITRTGATTADALFEYRATIAAGGQITGANTTTNTLDIGLNFTQPSGANATWANAQLIAVTGASTGNGITGQGLVVELLGAAGDTLQEIVAANDLAAGDLVRATLLCA